MNDLIKLFKNIENKNDFKEDFSIETTNVTNINHLIPASYYNRWIINNKKKARYSRVTLSNSNNSINLQNFMSRKFIINQELESCFTKYIINGKKYDTEKIHFISKIQKNIQKGNIKDFYFLSSKNNSISFNTTSIKFNQNEIDNIKKELNEFQNKNIDCKLYLEFFKTRLSLWEYSEKISSDTTLNLLEIIIKVIKKNSNINGIHYYKSTINLLLNFLNFGVAINKYSNKEITKENLQNELIEKNYSNMLILSKDKVNISKLLNDIIIFLSNNKFENSLFCANINSAFFGDFLRSFQFYDKGKNYLIVSSVDKLTTGESPMVHMNFSKEKTNKLINEAVINNMISSDFLKYNDKTEVYFIPYSPNILIIESESWYLNFFLYLINNKEQEKIIIHYEYIKSMHSKNNNYSILI